jgi:hypothetical protein
LSGNSATDTTVHYIGTADATSLRIKTDNETRMTINKNGNVGIDNELPEVAFQVGEGNYTDFDDNVSISVGKTVFIDTREDFDDPLGINYSHVNVTDFAPTVTHAFVGATGSGIKITGGSENIGFVAAHGVGNVVKDTYTGTEINALIGITTSSNNESGADVNFSAAVNGNVENNGTGFIEVAAGFVTEVIGDNIVNGNGLIVSEIEGNDFAHGILINQVNASGVSGRAVGLQISDAIVAAQTEDAWSIYSNSQMPTYFRGNMGINAQKPISRFQVNTPIAPLISSMFNLESPSLAIYDDTHDAATPATSVQATGLFVFDHAPTEDHAVKMSIGAIGQLRDSNNKVGTFGAFGGIVGTTNTYSGDIEDFGVQFFMARHEGSGKMKSLTGSSISLTHAGPDHVENARGYDSQIEPLENPTGTLQDAISFRGTIGDGNPPVALTGIQLAKGVMTDVTADEEALGMTIRARVFNGNSYGISIPQVSAETGNAYGFYLPMGSVYAVSGSAYSIYIQNEAPNYFGGRTGIRTADPKSTLHVNGSFSSALRPIAAGEPDENDYTLIVLGNINLPAPSVDNVGRIYKLINGDSSSKTITGIFRDAGADLTTASISLTSNPGEKAITVQSDGNQWWIISRN